MSTLRVRSEFTPVLVTDRGDVAPVLRQLRMKAGLTIEELTSRAGLPDRWIGKAESQPGASAKRWGFTITPDKVEASPSGALWMDTLGVALVLVPKDLAEAIGAVPAPKLEVRQGARPGPPAKAKAA